MIIFTPIVTTFTHIRYIINTIVFKIWLQFFFFLQINRQIIKTNVLNNVSGKFGVNIFIGKNGNFFSNFLEWC